MFLLSAPSLTLRVFRFSADDRFIEDTQRGITGV
jgi:hypothetical protein